MRIPKLKNRHRSGCIRFRFSLKILFLLMTLVAAYFAIGISRHHREQVAIKGIRDVGGKFASRRSSYFYPFVEVWVVEFQGRAFTNDKLRQVAHDLENVPGLAYLQLVQTGIDDDGVKQLANLRGLEKVDLWDNHITDQSLPILAQMSPSELDLRGTLVSDAGLPDLKRMTNLRKLTLPSDAPALAPPGSDEAELQKIGDEVIDSQMIPGIISKTAANSLAGSLQKCTVILNSTSHYSRRLAYPIGSPNAE